MSDPKEHLNIDLDFLDKKEPLKSTPKPKVDTQKSSTQNSSAQGGPTQSTPPKQTTASNQTPVSPTKYNWKNILIVGGLVLFFGWALFSGSSDDSGTTSTTPSSTSGDNSFVSETGQMFRCSDSNYSRALALKPDTANAASINAESDALDTRIAARDAMKDLIDDTYVDEYDDYSVDSYNEMVDDYNTRNNRLKVDIQNWNDKNDSLNVQIDTFNNFLDSNCTPQ